jgi:outer membrane protein assembly factor BamB
MGGGRGPQTAYVIASDGVLHRLGAMEGKDLKKPISFLPANAHVSDTIAIGDMLYVTTTNSCSGVPNGVWAIDLSAESPQAISWKSAADTPGMAFSSKGVLYVAAADTITALDPKTLQPKDSFSSPGANFSTVPVIFSYNDQELVAAAAKDGRVFLLDSAALGGMEHKTPLHVSAATTNVKTFTPSALATWEDAEKNRFVLLPAVQAKGGIVAFRVAGDASKPSLEEVWMTEDLGTPSAPIVVNGVMFALRSGSASSPAVLYAFDAHTGKEIWNSGKTIAGYVRSAGIWSSNAQVYVATQDATVYAFGFAMDRHQ